MPTSIRGQILDKIVTILAGTAGIGSVKRWDSRSGQTPLVTGDVIVYGQDSAPQQAMCGPVRDRMGVIILLIQIPDDGGTITTGIDNLRWQSLVKETLLNDPTIGALATVGEVELGFAPELGDGEVSCGVGMQIVWDHDADDVTTLGTLI